MSIAKMQNFNARALASKRLKIIPKTCVSVPSYKTSEKQINIRGYPAEISPEKTITLCSWYLFLRLSNCDSINVCISYSTSKKKKTKFVSWNLFCIYSRQIILSKLYKKNNCLGSPGSEILYYVHVPLFIFVLFKFVYLWKFIA